MSLRELYRGIPEVNGGIVNSVAGRRLDSSFTVPSDKAEGVGRYQSRILHFNQVRDELVAIVDKTGPHSITDLMLMVLSVEGRPTLNFTQCSDQAGHQILQWMHDFVRYIHTPRVVEMFDLNDAWMRIGINIDPFTEDRGSIQGERFLHPHCICYKNNAKDRSLRSLENKLSDLELFKLIDPLAAIGPKLLRELVFTEGSPFFCQTASKYLLPVAGSTSSQDGCSPFGLQLSLLDGWDTMKKPGMLVAIREIEKNMSLAYQYIRTVFTDDVIMSKWQRGKLLTPLEQCRRIKQLGFVSNESKQMLHILSSTLRDIPDKMMMRLEKGRRKGGLSLAERILSLAGYAYTMTLYSPGTIADSLRLNPPSPMMSIEPILRRPSGCAGLTHNHRGELTKIDRGSTAPVLSSAEAELRHQFQSEFISWVLENQTNSN
jgi:hypothetical protein